MILLMVMVYRENYSSVVFFLPELLGISPVLRPPMELATRKVNITAPTILVAPYSPSLYRGIFILFYFRNWRRDWELDIIFTRSSI